MTDLERSATPEDGEDQGASDEFEDDSDDEYEGEEFDDEDDEFVERVEAVEGELDAVEDELDAVEDELDAVEDELEAVEDELEAVEDELEAVEDEFELIDDSGNDEDTDDGGNDDDADDDDTDDVEPEGNRQVAPVASAVLTHIAACLVDDPDAVHLSTSELRGRKVRLSLRVAPNDLGRLIGRRGRVAASIRTVVGAAATRDGIDVEVEFAE